MEACGKYTCPLYTTPHQLDAPSVYPIYQIHRHLLPDRVYHSLRRLRWALLGSSSAVWSLLRSNAFAVLEQRHRDVNFTRFTRVVLLDCHWSKHNLAFDMWESDYSLTAPQLSRAASTYNRLLQDLQLM